MQVTGYKYRELYPQTGVINYYATVEVDNIVGVFSFGFSGSQSKVDLQAKSGKFYRGTGTFLQSYQAGVPFTISGAIAQTTNDLWYNNSPLYLGDAKPTGILDTFYVNADRCTAQISLRIDGDTPEYTYDPFESYYSGQIIPVAITNLSNYAFKIFSGNSLNPNFSLSGTSNLQISGTESLYLRANSFNNGAQTVPIELFTNFGRQQINFTASGQSLDNVQFYLIFGPNLPEIQDGTINQYTLLARQTTGLSLGFSLEYVSGVTGEYYAPIQSIYSGYTGLASGLITGSGELVGTNIGTVYYNNPLTGLESGVGTGELVRYKYSSGDLTGFYQQDITGLGSGLIPITATGTGYAVVNINTYVGPQGGIVYLNGLTGYGTGYSQAFNRMFSGDVYNGAVAVYVPYTGTVSGIESVVSPSDYETVTFSGNTFYYTGYVNKFYAVSGVAYATGEVITGVLQGDFGNIFEPGIYTFYRGFTGLASGSQSILESFDPITFQSVITGTSGIISGTYYTGLDARACEFELPEILPVGLPLQIYGPTGNLTTPLSIFHLAPINTGEYVNENSDATGARTEISRNGITPSGSGYFDNVFREPFYDSGIWTEYVTGFISEFTGTERAYIKETRVTAQMFNSTGLSGSFIISGINDYYQSYKWQGGVELGADFNDYSLNLYKITSSSRVLMKSFSSSKDIDLILNNGTYSFDILPIQGSVETPSLLTPATYYGVYGENSNIPILLTATTDQDITYSLSGQAGSAVNGVNYYIGSEFVVDKNAGIKYLPISILSEPTADVNFNLYLRYKSGGFISDISEKVISVNILKNNLGASLYPTTSNGGCCPEPTGISYVTCASYIGEKIVQGSRDGIYSEVIKFARPLSQYETLAFDNSVIGKNDVYKLDVLLSNSQPINLYTSSELANQSLSHNGFYTIPAGSYGLRYTMMAGALSVSNNREPWQVSFSCNSDAGCVDCSGSGSSNCFQEVDNVYITTLEKTYQNVIVKKNGTQVHSGIVPVTIPSTNFGDTFELSINPKSGQYYFASWGMVVNYTNGNSYTQTNIKNNANYGIGGTLTIFGSGNDISIGQVSLNVYDPSYLVTPLGDVSDGYNVSITPNQNNSEYNIINEVDAINKFTVARPDLVPTYGDYLGLYASLIRYETDNTNNIAVVYDIRRGSSILRTSDLSLGTSSPVRNVCPSAADACIPTGINIKSISYIDDDFYIKIGDTYLYNDKLNMAWYSGAERLWYPPSQYVVSSTTNLMSSGVNIILSGTNTYGLWSPDAGSEVFIANYPQRNVFSGICAGYWENGGNMSLGAVRYFALHDIITDGDGIGRANYTYFGAPWTQDVMGFLFTMPSEINGDTDFELSYEWKDLGGGYGRNKHGLGWWTDGVNGGGGIEEAFIGCWDPAYIGYQAHPSSSFTKTGITAPTSLTNTWIWRKITRSGHVWTIRDGPSNPADGSLGEVNFGSVATLAPYIGIKTAGTHRFRNFSGTFGTVNSSSMIIQPNDSILPFTGVSSSAWMVMPTNPGKINPSPVSLGFRELSISRSAMKMLGKDLTPGTQIQVGGFDGWGDARISEWSGTVGYAEGQYSFKNGVTQWYDSLSDTSTGYYRVYLAGGYGSTVGAPPDSPPILQYLSQGAPWTISKPGASSIEMLVTLDDIPTGYQLATGINRATINTTGLLALGVRVVGFATSAGTTVSLNSPGRSIADPVLGWNFISGVVQDTPFSFSAPESASGQLKYYFTAPTYERYIPNGGFII